MLWFNDYERRARLAPGLLALLPVSVTLTGFGFSRAPAVLSALVAISLAGGPILLAELVRQQGRKVQAGLWASWGGPPTTQKLRLRAAGQNALQRETWRQAVSSVSGVELSSVRSERANAVKADEAIEVAVGKIRNLTRDATKFPLVCAENRSYGFHRNLYGIRWTGRIIASSMMISSLGYVLWLAKVEHQPALTPVNTLTLTATAICCAIAWALPSPTRVRAAADRYAYELLQAAVVLADEKAGAPQGSS